MEIRVLAGPPGGGTADVSGFISSGAAVMSSLSRSWRDGACGFLPAGPCGPCGCGKGQSLVVVAFAPLYTGVIARAEAVVGSKRGPSVLQPYRDLGKLLRKGSAVSDQASWVFRGAPFAPFFAKLRFFRVAEFLGVAFMLALVGVATSYVIGA